MATVTFEKAQRWYPGADEPAVPGISLDIKDGEFMVLVGPSGCGKSTTLRMLAGLEEVNDGKIFIGDRDVTNVPPKDRDIAMVFQNYALYPHMSVEENMAFSLKMAKVPKAERKERVAKAAEILQLTEYLQRKPKALSGGQRQRVAMGRAIVRNPQVFCMDEPLSNLDAKMRVATRTDIAKLQQDLGVTTVYVTHDQVEAMTMGDRVAVMKLGILQQVDTPLKLYDKPANLFVAGFIGSPQMNLLEGVAAEDGDGQGRRLRRAGRPDRREEDVRQGHRRRPPGELAPGQRRGRRPAGHGDGRRGARRRQLRLRHLRRGGRALQRHRPHRRSAPPGRRARRSTSRPTRSTCTCSTPSRASASPTDHPIHTHRPPEQHAPGACASQPCTSSRRTVAVPPSATTSMPVLPGPGKTRSVRTTSPSPTKTSTDDSSTTHLQPDRPSPGGSGAVCTAAKPGWKSVVPDRSGPAPPCRRRASTHTVVRSSATDPHVQPEPVGRPGLDLRHDPERRRRDGQRRRAVELEVGRRVHDRARRAPRVAGPAPGGRRDAAATGGARASSSPGSRWPAPSLAYCQLLIQPCTTGSGPGASE